MKKVVSVFALGALVSLAAAQCASAIVIDFESGVVPSQFSGGTLSGTQGYSAYGFGGNFLWSENTITYTGSASASTLGLEFDLAIINSWDGSFVSVAPDIFNVSINGVELFDETFDFSDTSDQTYSGPYTVYNTPLYGNTWGDSAIHLSIQGVAITDGPLVISWYAGGSGWQGGNDESFAIDNIVLTQSADQNAVPEPTTMLLFGTGIAGLAAVGRKRRK